MYILLRFALTFNGIYIHAESLGHLTV